MDPSRFSKNDFDLKAVPVPLYAVSEPVAFWGALVVDPPRDAGFYSWTIQVADRIDPDDVGQALAQVIREVVEPWFAARSDPGSLLYTLSMKRDFETHPSLARITALSAAAIGEYENALRIIERYTDRWQDRFDTSEGLRTVRDELQDWAATIRVGPLAVRERIADAAKVGLRALGLNSKVTLLLPES